MILNDEDRSRQAFFNHRADTWLDTFYKDPDTGSHDRHQDKINTILDSLDIKPDSHILDLGCGAGVLVPYVLNRLSTPGRLVEMDYAHEMIWANQALHTDPRVSFKCAHVLDMPFSDACFDRIICFACFPHFQDQARALEQITRVLKPGGCLTIAHLMSSEEIAGHHNTETAVSNDVLPPRQMMEAWLIRCGLSLTAFTDMPGEYRICARKARSRPGD